MTFWCFHCWVWTYIYIWILPLLSKYCFSYRTRFPKIWNWYVRISRTQMLFKVDVLKSFANFTRKHKCWRPATLWKTRLQHWCLLVKFAKFLRTLVFTEHLRWLLLVYDNSRMTSSCTQLFFKIGVLKSFVNCTGKRTCFFILKKCFYC